MLETTLFVITISTLGMLSPGPDFFLVIKNAARYPRPVAMMTAFGVTCGIATHMTYCVAGLAVLITTTPWLFNFLKYAGAVYLIWIGIQALRAKGGNSLNIEEVEIQSSSLKSAFMQGYLCNLLNPKATLFFLAVFTQVLEINSSFGEKLWYAFIIWILAVIWWPILILLIQSKPVRRGLARMHKWVDRLLGIALIALGVKVGLS